MDQIFEMLEDSHQSGQLHNAVDEMFRMREVSHQIIQPRNGMDEMRRVLVDSHQSRQPRNTMDEMRRVCVDSHLSRQPRNGMDGMFRMPEDSHQSRQPSNGMDVMFRMPEDSHQSRQPRNGMDEMCRVLVDSHLSGQPRNGMDEMRRLLVDSHLSRQPRNGMDELRRLLVDSHLSRQPRNGMDVMFRMPEDSHQSKQLHNGMDVMFKVLEDSHQSRQPRNGMNELIAYELKATDFAIALSLQEQEQNVLKEQNERAVIALFEEDHEQDEAQLEKDQEIAMAVHENLDTESLTGSEDGFTFWSYPSHIVSNRRFQSSGNDVIIAQLEEDYKSGRMQSMEDEEERFQLTQLEDEELALAILASSVETGEGDSFQPDPSSVSYGQGMPLPEYENVSISQFEDVERYRSSQFMEDEQLALSIQESLMLESADQLKRICAGCNSFGHGQFINRMDVDWHLECFRCHECGLEIADEEFQQSGDNPYHNTCHEEVFHPKCEVCKNRIPTQSEFRYHPFWKRKYCALHDEDGTPTCYSCERLVPRGKYLTLDDGRKLCIECSESAIMDAFECQPLYREIREFYEDLDMKIEQHIILDLVELQTLNDAKKGQKKGNHDVPHKTGLTIYNDNEVPVILLLKGLPRLLVGNILAHEMMHSWIRLKGIHDLSSQVEEGICQVMAHLWLEYEIDKITTCNSIASSSVSSSSSSSSSESTSWKKGKWTDVYHKLANCFKYQIETNASPTYGKGFELAHKAVVKYGLEGTLSLIQMTRSIPS